jgi:hypothetical protein
MVLFLLFLAELFALFMLSRALTRSISWTVYRLTHSQTIAIRVLSLLFFPGTLIHELSHAIMAGLLGVRVGTMEFVPKIDGNKVKMGSVQIEQTDFFRRFFIGAAPFFIGTSLLLGSLYFASTNHLFENYWMIAFIGYVVFEIGNTMFSSKKDMEGALELLLTLTIIVIIFYFFGVRLPAVNPDIFFEQPVVHEILQKGCWFLLVPLILDCLVIMLFRIGKK